jgi:hypothetical protein
MLLRTAQTENSHSHRGPDPDLSRELEWNAITGPNAIVCFSSTTVRQKPAHTACVVAVGGELWGRNTAPLAFHRRSRASKQSRGGR